MPRAVRPGQPPTGNDGILALGRHIREIGRSVPIFVTDTLNITPARNANCTNDWADIAGLGENGTLSSQFRGVAFAPDSAGDKAGQVETVAANWLDDESQYPIGILVASPQRACNATATALPNSIGDAAGGYLLSPAATLYALYCRDPRSNCQTLPRLDAAGRPAGFRLYALADDFRRRMLIEWGTRQSTQFRADFAQAERADDCLAQNQNSIFYEAFVQSLHAVLPVLDRLFGAADRPCPFIDTLPATMVIEPERYFPGPRADAVLHDYLAAALS